MIGENLGSLLYGDVSVMHRRVNVNIRGWYTDVRTKENAVTWIHFIFEGTVYFNSIRNIK